MSRDWREASDFAFGKKTFFACEKNTYEETIKLLGGYGGLQLIDDLVVDYCYSWNDTKQQSLEDFIRAIPRNQLKNFRCRRKQLPLYIMKILLERQQHLRLFSVVNVVVRKPYEATILSEIGGLLSSCEQLQDFHLGFDTKSVRQYEGQRYIVRSLPKLRSLSLDFMDNKEPGLFFNCPSQPARVFELESLQLSQADLYSTTFSVQSHVNLSKLVVLKLYYLTGGTDMFQNLAASFQSLGDQGTSLKTLEVTLACNGYNFNGINYIRRDGPQVLSALETLIQSFRGLHDLVINTATCGLIRASCIEHHAHTLRNLYVHSYGLSNADLSEPKSFRYSRNEFRSIICSARNLETLAVNFPSAIERVTGNTPPGTDHVDYDCRQWLVSKSNKTAVC